MHEVELMDTINWLQDWYKQNCDGDWEHSYGINIYTVDNPGWSVNIELTDTNWNLKTLRQYKYTLMRTIGYTVKLLMENL
jgi:hypothetical protein